MGGVDDGVRLSVELWGIVSKSSYFLIFCSILLLITSNAAIDC